jgi:hypothetical protein
MTTQALLVVAAETAEVSKTAFYILGGALVAWAILLALIGLSRPEFPGNPSTARGLYGISALLVVGAVASAVLTG